MKGFGGMKFKGGGVGLGKRSGGGSISMKIGGALVSTCTCITILLQFY